MEKLTGLKDAPLWFLSAVWVIVLALWRITTLRSLVPADYQKFLPLAALVLSLLAVAQGINLIAIAFVARLAARREQQRLQLQKILRPMLTLFMSRHVTTSSAILAPRFGDRIKQAGEVWSNRLRWRAKIKDAKAALWDRQEISAAEMEYGGAFPIDKILSIANANAEHVDPTLRGFIRRADRSRYEEEPDDGTVTDAEYALFQHLWEEETRLAKATAR